MGVLLRPLYAKVSFMRPDLEETSKIGFAVQEAMREVCRRTFLARKSITSALEAGASSITITQMQSWNLLKVHQVKFTDADGEDHLLAPKDSETMKALTGDSEGIPAYYSQQGQFLMLYPAAEEAGTLTMEVSYVPTEDVEEAPLPEIAVTAIEARAESMLLRLPDANPAKDGARYQSLGHARERERDFHLTIGNLKAISLYGEVGDVETMIDPFPGAP